MAEARSASRARFSAIIRKHLRGKGRQLQTRSLCSPELKPLCENYEKVWKRTGGTIPSVDSFFSYDFRVAVCSCCAGRSRERLAIAENFFAGDCLHGVRAHGSHAFQPAR